MGTTKAYVTRDGEVLSAGYMNQYLLKQEGDGSNQLPTDSFIDSYGGYGLVEPLYNLEALAQLLEINAYHYAAVKTKARDIAGLGWQVVPMDNTDNPNEDNKEQVIEFFKNLSPDETLTEVTEKVMVDFEATGNGYFEVIRDMDGNEVVGMKHIPAQTMRAHKDMQRYVQQREGRRVWFKSVGVEEDVDKHTGEMQETGAVATERRATEVLHLKNYTARSDYYGVPDIVPSLGAILGDREQQEYNISFFDNHAIPAYAVTISGAELDEDTEREIQNFFQKDVKEQNHSTLVLTGKPDSSDVDAPPINFEFHALSTDMKEASFRMFRQDNRDEILSAHRMPPYRAGITIEGQMGGSSAEETTEIYKQSVVKPKQEMLESRFDKFLLQDGMDIHDWSFKLDEIDTRDEDREIDKAKKLFDMGYYSPNQLRELFGDEPVDDENMDTHFINGQPIGSLGQQGRQEFMSSVKQLHENLAEVVRKDGHG